MSSFFASFSSRAFFGFVGRVVKLDQFHRGLVRPAVQRSAQRPDAADDGAVEIGQRGRDDTHGKRRGVELVFRVEHERHVHRADV